MTLTVTIIFVGILALMQVPMTMAVGIQRAKTSIPFLDGGDQGLMRNMRAHANFTETVPITLLAMAAAELSGAPQSLLIGGGIVLIGARLIHYFSLRKADNGTGRAVGSGVTLLVMAVFAVTALLAISGVI